jgi:hypothetical protein
MARVKAIVVSKRLWNAVAGLVCLSVAQLVLASCEPDEFVPMGATRAAHAQ